MENEIKCPKCNGRNIAQGERGYSLGKAAVGGVILGPLGLLAGNHKSRDIRFTCLDCGHKFSVEDAIRARRTYEPPRHQSHQCETPSSTPEERAKKAKVLRVVRLLILVGFIVITILAIKYR